MCTVPPVQDATEARADELDGLAENPAANDDGEEPDDDEEEQANTETPGKACIASHPGAMTSNQTLRQWLPKCDTVAALWEATEEMKIQSRTTECDALVRVAYQCQTNVTWKEETLALAGRTLEEAFALENLSWCQDVGCKPLSYVLPEQ